MNEEGIPIDWCAKHEASWIASIEGCGIGHPDEFGPCEKVRARLVFLPHALDCAEDPDHGGMCLAPEEMAADAG